MGIAIHLAEYLNEQDVPYDIVNHPRTVTTSGSAVESHVPSDRLAKAVVLKGGDGYLVAVLPASHHIRFGELRKLLGREVDLANEEEIETLFVDCEPGAVPPLGAAYGLTVLMDDSLARDSDVYFEGGDHASLVHVTGESFRKLMVDARHGRFAEQT
jgi:Ala-tRNA(Pro) deacylase